MTPIEIARRHGGGHPVSGEVTLNRVELWALATDYLLVQRALSAAEREREELRAELNTLDNARDELAKLGYPRPGTEEESPWTSIRHLGRRVQAAEASRDAAQAALAAVIAWGTQERDTARNIAHGDNDGFYHGLADGFDAMLKRLSAPAADAKHEAGRSET